MPSLTTLLPLALLLWQAAAAPAPNEDEPFSLPITWRTRSVNGLDHEKRQAKSNALRNYQNSFFTVPVQVGTPAQKLDLVVETASRYTYVYSPQCDGMDEQSKPFNYARSKTYNEDGTGTSMTFQDGSMVSGPWGTDTIGFDKKPRAKNQRFILANTVEDEPWAGVGLATAPDGVIGFGLPIDDSVQPKLPTWYSLTTPAKRMFSIYLRNVAELPEDGSPTLRGGLLTLGGINKKCISDDPVWNPVIESEARQWVIGMDSIQVGETPIPIKTSTTEALINTGSSTMAGPRADVKSFYKHGFPASWHIRKDGNRYRLFNTKHADTPRHVSFFFNGEEYEIAKDQLWYQDGEDENGNPKWYGFLEVNEEYDQNRNGAVPWVIGTPLLMNIYSSFRVTADGSAEVGFSHLKQTPTGGYACDV